MKSPLPHDKPRRFQGALRHYHRPHSPVSSPWEDWGGNPQGLSRWLRRLKIFSVILAVLVLLAIIAGLIIELR